MYQKTCDWWHRRCVIRVDAAVEGLQGIKQPCLSFFTLSIQRRCFLLMPTSGAYLAHTFVADLRFIICGWNIVVIISKCLLLFYRQPCCVPSRFLSPNRPIGSSTTLRYWVDCNVVDELININRSYVATRQILAAGSILFYFPLGYQVTTEPVMLYHVISFYQKLDMVEVHIWILLVWSRQDLPGKPPGFSVHTKWHFYKMKTTAQRITLPANTSVLKRI